MQKLHKFLILAVVGVFIFLPLTQTKAASLTERVKGRVLLQVQQHGEAWYVNPVDGKKIYLYNGDVAYGLMRSFGLGIKNVDLNKIPVGVLAALQGNDADTDGLGDYLEAALGTNDLNKDTDNDGYTDGNEVKTNNNPLGAGRTLVDSKLANRLKGRILLQTENHGQAWYVNPVDGKRYYLRDGNDAYGLMKALGLGINDSDLGKIPVDNGHPEVYKYLIENTYPTSGSAGSTGYTYDWTKAAQPASGDTSGQSAAKPTTGNTVNLSKSLKFGLVNFHYYDNLGGISSETFRADQIYAAKNVDLGIIGWGDTGMAASWNEIKRNEPQGKWLKWRSAQVLNTRLAAGTCERPERGATDQSFDYQKKELESFLQVYDHYGDGETCFLHAQNDGTIKVNWQANACKPALTVKTGARLETLVQNKYGWLLDISSDCAKDFIAWRTIKDVWQESYGGVGFDHLGNPMADGYYLPDLRNSTAKISEVEDYIENNPDTLDNWYYTHLTELLAYVNAEVQKLAPGTKIVYNAGAYCSEVDSVNQLKQNASRNLGLWCENALQYPVWGTLDTVDRLRTLIGLSDAVGSNGGFMALEVFSNNGKNDPTPAEAMFYLAAYYNYKTSTDDVLAIRPGGNPYKPMKDNTWFEVFNRDLGQPRAKAVESANGVFVRSYYKSNGQEGLVIVRVDGLDGNTVNYNLGTGYCQLDVNNKLKPAAENLQINSGDGLIFLKKGAGDVSC